MSKIIFDGFRISEAQTDQEAILIKNIVWYDKVHNFIKVGNKVLNYYVENNEKVLTTLTQAELPGKAILPLEFSVITPI